MAADVVVDPLATPVGALGGAGAAAFRLIRRLREELGVNTTRGASNIVNRALIGVNQGLSPFEINRGLSPFNTSATVSPPAAPTWRSSRAGNWA